MKRSVFRRFAVSACLLLGLASCSDRLEPPTTPAELPAGTVRSHAREASVQALSGALARALASSSLRRQILEDLRDSPFPQHRIHLRSYLQGARGGGLAAAAAASMGMEAPQFATLLGSLPDLELVVPRPSDRMHWTGSDSLAVFGTTLSGPELIGGRSVKGYTPAGVPVTLGVFEVAPYAVIMLRPSEVDFGRDPETGGPPLRAGREDQQAGG